MAVAGGRDRSCVLLELLQLQREEEDLKAKYQEKKQMLGSLQQREEELHKNMQEPHFDINHTMLDSLQQREELCKNMQEMREAKLGRLREECAELTERKQELEDWVQRHSVCRDIMEQLLKRTKFEDVAVLTGHFESLLHFRGQFRERESKAQERVDQQRKVLLALEDQHNLLMLQKNNQLSQLQTELDKTHSENLIWERRWNNIQKTAAKKTLTLWQIKMATLDLYEMTGEQIGEEGVDMDTEKQLEQIKMFVKDQTDIVKRHQTPLQRPNDGQGTHKAKNSTQYKKM